MFKKIRKGQGLVEFALMLPIILLVLLGIIEGAYLVWSYITIQNAAREAARYAVTGAPRDSQGESWTASEEERTMEIIRVARESAGALPVQFEAYPQTAAEVKTIIDTPGVVVENTPYQTGFSQPQALGILIRGQTADSIQAAQAAGIPDGGEVYHPGLKGLNVLVRVYYTAQMLDPIYNALLGGNTVLLRGESILQNEGVNLALGSELPEFAPGQDSGQDGAGPDQVLLPELDVNYLGEPYNIPAGANVDVTLSRHTPSTQYYVCLGPDGTPTNARGPFQTNASGNNAFPISYPIPVSFPQGIAYFTSHEQADCSDPPVAKQEVNILVSVLPRVGVDSGSPNVAENDQVWPDNSLVEVFVVNHDDGVPYTAYLNGQKLRTDGGADCILTPDTSRGAKEECVIPNGMAGATYDITTTLTITEPGQVKVTDQADLVIVGGTGDLLDGDRLEVTLRDHAKDIEYYLKGYRHGDSIAVAGDQTAKTNEDGATSVTFALPIGYGGSFTLQSQDRDEPVPPSAQRQIADLTFDVTVPTVPTIQVQNGRTHPSGSIILVDLRAHLPNTTYDVFFDDNGSDREIIGTFTTDDNGNYRDASYKIPVGLQGSKDISSFPESGSNMVATTEITVTSAPYIVIENGDQHPPGATITATLKDHLANAAYDVYIDEDGDPLTGVHGTAAEKLIVDGLVMNGSGENDFQYTIPFDITPVGTNAEDAHKIVSVRNDSDVASVDLFVVVADLQVTNVVPPVDPQPGADLPIALHVTNNSEITLSTFVFDNDLYFDPPPGVPDQTNIFPPGDEKVWITGIGPNQTKVITPVINVFNEGTYQVYGRTDTSDGIVESLENNNVNSTFINLVCTLTPYVDNFDDNVIDSSWTMTTFGDANAPLVSLDVEPTEMYALNSIVNPTDLDLVGPPRLAVPRSTPQPITIEVEEAGTSPGSYKIEPAVFGAEAAAIPAQQSLPVSINFQHSNSEGYAGYLEDTGETFGNRGGGNRYGWNSDNTLSVRNRNSSNSPDERYDTLNHMQKGGDYFWEIEVPIGDYQVRVVAGDPSHTNSDYRINVEGVLAVDGVPDNSNRWVEGTVNVTVNDGRLTVSNAPGASNNKIAFIEIAELASVPTPTPIPEDTPTPEPGGGYCGPSDSFQEVGGQVVMEAEHFTGSVAGTGSADTKTWETTTTYSGYTGSSAMQAVTNSGVNTGLSTEGPALLYRIDFQTPGRYYVYLRGSGSSNSDDSVHAGIDGNAVTLAGYGLTGFNSSFTWQNHYDNTDAYIDIPSAGTYTFYLWMREDGVVADKIWLDQTQNAVSNGDTGTGPSESACTTPGPTPTPTFTPIPTSTPDAAFAAPTITSVSTTTSTIDVTWSYTGTTQNGFVIERSLDGSNFSEIAVITDPAERTYIDDPLSCETTYYYRVIAYQGDVSTGTRSLPSAVESGTTGTCPPSSCTITDEINVDGVGLLNLCSSGTGFGFGSGYSDDNQGGYAFLNRRISGNSFDMVIKLASVPGAAGDAMAGFEVRDNPAANPSVAVPNSSAKKVSLVVRNSNTQEIGAFSRNASNAAVTQVGNWTNMQDDVPAWLRIVRANGSFSFYYYSRNDQIAPVLGSWTLLTSVPDTMDQDVFVGPISASASQSLNPSTWEQFSIGCLAVASSTCGVVKEDSGIVIVDAINFTDNFAGSENPTDSWSAAPRTVNSNQYAGMSYNGSDYTDPIPDFVVGPMLEYSVNIETPGDYYVWVLGYAPNTSGNSIHVGLNGQTVDTADKMTMSGSGLQWFNNTADDQPAILDGLSQGVHTVNVWGREDDFELIQILLTTDPNYSPDAQIPSGAPKNFNQSACLVPAPPELPANLQQCTNVLQNTSFEDGDPTVDVNSFVWTVSGQSSRYPFPYPQGVANFGIRLPASNNSAPVLRQVFEMPTWLNDQSTATVSLFKAVEKLVNDSTGGSGAVNSPDDKLYFVLRDANTGETLTTPMLVANGAESPPVGFNVDPLNPTAGGKDLIDNWTEFTDDAFTYYTDDIQALAGRTVEAYFYSPNVPSEFGYPFTTNFFMDLVDIEVCTKQPAPPSQPSTGTISGQLEVLINNAKQRLQGVQVWAYKVDGPLNTTYTVNTGFGQDNYSFHNLEPGLYTVYAQYVDSGGFVFGASRSVSVSAGLVTKQNLLLVLGGN